MYLILVGVPDASMTAIICKFINSLKPYCNGHLIFTTPDPRIPAVFYRLEHPIGT